MVAQALSDSNTTVSAGAPEDPEEDDTTAFTVRPVPPATSVDKLKSMQMSASAAEKFLYHVRRYESSAAAAKAMAAVSVEWTPSEDAALLQWMADRSVTEKKIRNNRSGLIGQKGERIWRDAELAGLCSRNARTWKQMDARCQGHLMQQVADGAMQLPAGAKGRASAGAAGTPGSDAGGVSMDVEPAPAPASEGRPRRAAAIAAEVSVAVVVADTTEEDLIAIEPPTAAKQKTPTAAKQKTPTAAKQKTPTAAKQKTPTAAKQETPTAAKQKTPTAAKQKTPQSLASTKRKRAPAAVTRLLEMAPSGGRKFIKRYETATAAAFAMNSVSVPWMPTEDAALLQWITDRGVTEKKIRSNRSGLLGPKGEALWRDAERAGVCAPRTWEEMDARCQGRLMDQISDGKMKLPASTLERAAGGAGALEHGEDDRDAAAILRGAAAVAQAALAAENEETRRSTPTAAAPVIDPPPLRAQEHVPPPGERLDVQVRRQRARRWQWVGCVFNRPALTFS